MITRREFLRNGVLFTTALGGFGAPSMLKDVHGASATHFKFASFLEENPNAVFIRRTAVNARTDHAGFEREGHTLAQMLFEPSDRGWSVHTPVVIKPNIVRSGPKAGDPPELTEGVNTNAYFVGGFIDGMRTICDSDFTLVERGAYDFVFKMRGYTALSQQKQFRLINYLRPTYKDYRDNELNWLDVQDGYMLKRIPVLRPVMDPGTLFINMPTFKTHFVGIVTLASKNHQGVVPTGYGHFCRALEGITELDPEQLEHFQPASEIKKFVMREKIRHMREGYFRWLAQDSRDEVWVHRILDTLTAVKPNLSVIEGIIARDGDYAFHGKHYLYNVVIFGRNPLYVDMIGHYLAGHYPWNVGLFRIARERDCIPTVLPQNVDVYELTDEGPQLIENVEGWQKKYPLALLHHSDRTMKRTDRKYFVFLDQPVTDEILKGEKFSRDMNFRISPPGDERSSFDFSYSVERAGDVELNIYNAEGQTIHSVHRHQASGFHNMLWNTCGHHGIPVPKGQYAAQLRANGKSIVQKIYIS